MLSKMTFPSNLDGKVPGTRGYVPDPSNKFSRDPGSCPVPGTRYFLDCRSCVLPDLVPFAEVPARVLPGNQGKKDKHAGHGLDPSRDPIRSYTTTVNKSCATLIEYTSNAGVSYR